MYASSSTGLGLDLQLALDLVYVDANYVSGSQINSSATFAGDTLAFLGLTTGLYSFAAGNSETINLHIGEAAPVVSAAPEPATWAMMIMGFGMLGFAFRRRRPANGRVGLA